MTDEPVTTLYAPFACWSCGKVMTAASHVDGKSVPKQGDISVCLDCAEAMTLDDGAWRQLTDDELIDMELEDKKVLARMQILVREFIKHQKEKKA